MRIAPDVRFRQFFATVPVPCPYLPEMSEQKLVVELRGSDSGRLFSDLSRAGFRRSHGLAYRPACRNCAACVPVRIRVSAWHRSRTLRRVIRRNEALSLEAAPARATAEQYALFASYLAVRHGSSDMTGMDFGEYRAMVETTPVPTGVMEAREPDGSLVACCLVDRSDDALSAVYSFYDPSDPRRSLGTWMIDRLVGIAEERGLSFVYLGYWIENSPTMGYKRRLPALEGLIGGVWQPLPES